MTITPSIPTVVFSSQLPLPKAATPSGQVTFTVRGGGEEIYTTTIYTFGGAVALHGFRDLIEDAMRERGLGYMAVEVTCAPLDPDEDNTASVSFGVVYCEQRTQVPAETWLAQRFLTTATARRAYPGGRQLLSLFRKAGENKPVGYSIIYRREDGECRVGKAQTALGAAASNGITTISVGWDEMQDIMETEGMEGELLGWTVIVGDRAASFYYDDSEADQSLLFRNCFNVWEAAQFTCVTDSKTTLERSEATLEGETVWYDYRRKTGNEVHTSPLTREEAEWLSQMVTSREIRLDDAATAMANVAQLPEILMEESEVTVSDNPETTNTISFTWRYADNRQALPGAGEAAGIFDSTFDISYN